MSYIVFARKYRPQLFDEIVGQSHITTTLKNAISQGRVAHAYIFAGPRGIGKTTTARILAKAINCESGPTSEPCNSCPSCREITQGSSLDILEIDGASNRGIDEIRNLRDNIKFAPSKGRFKLYIIDEVHMLTAEAFNALLKTLEEPPAHVKFIFATTQPHKVPLTILSRCQRFDFRRLSTKDILGNLKEIVKKENLHVLDEALILIARHADGSMRDGQVILDQMISFTEGRIELEDVVKILGIVDEDILFGLSDSINKKDAVKALKIIDDLINEGKDVSLVISSLIEHFRNISVIKISSDLNSLIDAGTDKIRRYEEEAQKFSIEEILYIIYTLSNTIDFVRKSNLVRVPLEASLVKLTKASSIVSLNSILEKVNRLEHASQPSPSQKLEVPEKSAKPEESEHTADMEEILSSWNSVINYIKTRKISVASYLGEGDPKNLNGKVLSIAIPKEFKFHKEMLEYPENRRLIEEAIKEITKFDLKIIFTLAESASGRDSGKEEDLGKESADSSLIREKQESKKEVDPIIKSALDVFGGTILREEERKR